ncbi:MAG: two-component system sensor histidine kinase NtrB [Lysobacterales bacterium]
MSVSTQHLPRVLQHEDVLDLMDTAFIQLDQDGRVRLMNAAAEYGLCLGRERAFERPLRQIAQLPEALHAALAQPGQPGTCMRLHEVQFAGGQYDCTIHAGERNQVLLELHNLEWEHKRLRLQHREMQTGLLELLSRNLGHEIRNPLGGIRGASQMLANELESPEMATLARLIMREADRIDELIQRFGQPSMAEGEVDFYPLLDEVLALMDLEFSHQAQIERDFDPSIPTFRGDGPAIRQILLNLVRNAFQAGASQVIIRTRVEQGGALLQTAATSLLRVDIVDDGEGVPESLRNLLFLPLVTGRRNGTGLGLALSQQIAAAHGGLLTYEPVQSEPGSGSRFSLYLPLEKAHSADAGVKP